MGAQAEQAREKAPLAVRELVPRSIPDIPAVPGQPVQGQLPAAPAAP